MADKRCENGHFIDESWDLCPYCPVEGGAEGVGQSTTSAVVQSLLAMLVMNALLTGIFFFAG